MPRRALAHGRFRLLSATVTVGQQLGASIGTSLLNTILAGAVASYLTVHAASARILGARARGGLAVAHGYDIAFWWVAGIFAAGGSSVGPCSSAARSPPRTRRRCPAR